MNTLAERLAHLMELHDVSKVDLARAAKTTRQAVYQWLSGETKALKGTSLIGAARILKTTPDWLNTGKGERDARPGVGAAELSRDAIEVARAWMLLPDFKQKGYAQGIMTDAAVMQVFPELEKAMRAAAVAADPSYHRMTEGFRRARAQLKHQLELDLKEDQ